MTSKVSGKPQKTLRPRGSAIELDDGLAAAAAAVLGQLYGWHPRLKPREEAPQMPEQFDVRATFDALNRSGR